jgi:chromate transporter
VDHPCPAQDGPDRLLLARSMTDPPHQAEDRGGSPAKARRPADAGVDRDGEAAAAHPPGFGSFVRYFLGLGSWGFGGPIATVGYMQRDLVERRNWMTRADFLDGVALGQTMPGPLAAQVAMWVGYLRRGAFGAIAVAAAFIAPSFILVLTVAAIYRRYSGLPVVQSLFYGIAPVVVAIIAVAAWKLAKLTNKSDRRLWGISVALMLVTAITGAEIAYLVIAAGLLMLLWDAPPRRLLPRRARPGSRPTDPPAAAGALAALGAAKHSWIVPSAAGGTLLALGLFFAKAGAFIFGSGLAIVPFLRQGVVVQHHWLTSGQFLDAIAMGLITPGPVVITATFIGYLAGGLAGAVIATVAIFTPIYLAVVIPGRWFVRHRGNQQVKAFVRGATAAAAGAIAGAVTVLARQAIPDWKTVFLAVAALALSLKWKVKEPYLVGLGAVAGILLHWGSHPF